MDPVRAHVAILSVAGSSTRTEVAVENIIADALTGAGHEVTSFETVRDSEVAIRAQLTGWIEDPDVDLVIIVGEGQATTRALNTLVDERLPGFADLLRMVAFQAVGAGAMLSSPEAARCGQTFVFVLPAGEKAARAAMEKLILPQLDPATKPHNLVDKLPRLREDGDVTRVDNASGPAESIPVPVAAEKTATGRPFPLRPPAKHAAPRTKAKTNQNILRPAPSSGSKTVDDPTKPIELVKLEQQLELSKPEPAPPPPGDRTKPLDLSAPSSSGSIQVPKVFPPVPSPARETPRGITAVSPTVVTPLQPSVTEWAAEPERISPTRSGQMPALRPPDDKAPTRVTPPLANDGPTRVAPAPEAPTRVAPAPEAPTRVAPAPEAPTRVAPAPLPSLARTTPPPMPAVMPPATLPSLTRTTPPPMPAVMPTPPATLPQLEPAVRTTAMQNTVAAKPPPEELSIPPERETEEAPTVPARTPQPPVASSIIGRPKQPTPAPAVVVIPPRTRQPTPPVPTKVVIPAREEAPATPRPRQPTPPVPTTMITTPPPAPRSRALTPPVPQAAMRPRTQTPPSAMKAVTGLPKLPPGASGELLESDLLESADDIPAMKAPPFVEEVVELEPAPKKNVVELPPPHPAATPVDEPRRAKPPTDRAPRSRSGTAPVDPLPAGTFTYPTRKRRSLVPLAIALMLLAALAGAGIVLFLNRSKKQEPAKKDPIAQAPNTIDAAQVAALDAGMPAPDIDAAEIEVVVESPDAAVATRPPKPPRTPPDAAPRIATAPIDAAPRIETAPIDAAPRRPDPPPDAAVAVVAPPVDAAPPPVVVADGCDETTCVMENYAKPCCARWKPNTVGNFGQTLEKSQIRAGISGVKAAIVACGEKSSAKGTVTVSVTVSPDGAVTGVSVASSPDGQLGACVAAAVRRASFAKTARGGSFNYPFVF